LKLPNWLKVIWYLAIVILLGVFVFTRWETISSASPNTIDIIIILTLIALLLAPLFREVAFFGVTLKKDIDNLRSELKEQIISLKSEINNTINMRTEISPQIQLSIPPTDMEVKNFMDEYEPILKKMKGSGKETTTPELQVPEDTKFLFNVRYSIEKELNRIWSELRSKAKEISLWTGQVPQELDRPQSAFQLVRSLNQLQMINPELASLTREVYRACSAAIHGREITKTVMNFVRDVSPGLIASLQATKVTIQTKSEE
jgi:hypothetical protein